MSNDTLTEKKYSRSSQSIPVLPWIVLSYGMIIELCPFSVESMILHSEPAHCRVLHSSFSIIIVPKLSIRLTFRYPNLLILFIHSESIPAIFAWKASLGAANSEMWLSNVFKMFLRESNYSSSTTRCRALSSSCWDGTSSFWIKDCSLICQNHGPESHVSIWMLTFQLVSRCSFRWSPQKELPMLSRQNPHLF
jgi:hypothetical protein